MSKEVNMTNYVWYASYGSNISNERFLCYILGGKAKGALTSEVGCRSSDLPISSKNLTINRQQYFAKKSNRWQEKSVAFLDSQMSDESTYGRMYLISVDQFEDVVKQENSLSINEPIDLKLKEAKEMGSAVVTKGWYGRIMYLGESENYPIYTFTNPVDLKEEPINMPSEEYILMIASGLIDNYNFNINELSQYFYNKLGVSKGYSLENVNNMLKPLFI